MAMLCNDGVLAVERWPVGLDGEGAVVTHAYASIYVPFKISNEIDNACIKTSLHTGAGASIPSFDVRRGLEV